MEVDETGAKGVTVVGDTSGVSEAVAEVEGGGDCDVKAFGSEFLAEAERGVHVALAGEGDHEDIARGLGLGGHFRELKQWSVDEAKRKAVSVVFYKPPFTTLFHTYSLSSKP